MKKKSIIRILSLVLVGALVVSQPMTAYAASELDNTNNEIIDDKITDNEESNETADTKADDILVIGDDQDTNNTTGDQTTVDTTVEAGDSEVEENLNESLTTLVGSGIDDEYITLTSTNMDASGTIEETNISWKVEFNDNNTFTLTVSGTGAIPDYPYGGAPWDAYKNYICKKIIVEDGIEVIGTSAFVPCSNSTVDGKFDAVEVEIGNTVKEIKKAAFATVPITSITLPDSLVTIGENAFSDTKLSEITIPKNVNVVGGRAFEASGVKKVTVLSTFLSDDTGNAAWWGLGPFGQCKLEEIIIGEGVQRIPAHFFSAWVKDYTEIVIPSSVTEIGEAALTLENAIGDKETGFVTISFAPNSQLKTIKKLAFANVSFTDCVINLPSSLKTIEREVFVGSNLKEITIPEGVLSIGNSALDTESLRKVVLPSTLKDMSDTTPFYSWHTTESPLVDVYVVKGSYAHNWLKSHQVYGSKYEDYGNFRIMTSGSIKYMLNGGNNNDLNPGSYNPGEVVTLEDPTRAGYVFDGWYYDAKFTRKVEGSLDTSKGEDITVYAKWSVKTYPVTYNANGAEGDDATVLGDATVDVAFGAAFPKALATATRTGYTFAGWYTAPTGGTKISGGSTKFTSDDPDTAQIFAHWTAIKYNVRFNANYPNGKNTTTVQQLTYDKAENLKTAAQLKFAVAGYTFVGWTTDKNGTVSDTEGYADGAEISTNLANKANATVDFYAQWKAVDYVVFFNAGDPAGVEDGTLELGANALLGMTTEDLAAYDWKTAKAVDSSFDEVQALSTQGYVQAIKMGESFELTGEEFVKPGFTLTGWKNENTKKILKNGIISNITTKGEVIVLTAQWKQDTFTVKYNLNGGKFTDPKAAISSYKTKLTGDGDYKADKIELQVPVRAGYTFGGWYEDKAFTGDPVTYVGDDVLKSLNLFAKWNANGYEVVFDGNLGTNNSDIANFGEGEDTVNNDNNTRTIIFAHDKQYTLNKTLFTRKGYVLASWNTKADGKGRTYAVTANVKNIDNVGTLYAIWNPITYKITYDLDGGKQSGATTTYTTAKGAILKIPTKTGYFFTGWQVVGADKDADFGLSYDRETVYETEDATSGTPYKYNGEIVNKAVTSEIPAGSVGSIKLKAKWVPKSYKVIIKVNTDTSNINEFYKHQGDQVGQISSTYMENYYSYESIFFQNNIAMNIEDTYLTDEAKETMSITGFTTNPNGSGTKYVLNKTYKNLSNKHGQEIVLYAQWNTKNKEYHILYDQIPTTYLNGAVSSYLNGKTVTIKAPVKEGYNFNGWEIKKAEYDTFESNGSTQLGIKYGQLSDEDLNYTYNEKTKVLTIKGGKTGLILKALFTPVTYNVVVYDNYTTNKVVVNNVAITGNYDINGTYDDNAFIQAPAARDGYTFKGYNLRKDGKGQWIHHNETLGYSVMGLSTRQGSTVNVYAIWEANGFDIAYNFVDQNGSDISAYVTANKNSSAGTVGKLVNLAKPVATGYTFKGWEDVSTDNVSITKDRFGYVTKINAANVGNVSLKAVFTENAYTLRISSNGGVLSTGNNNLGTVNKAVNKVEKTGVKYTEDVTDLIAKYDGKFEKKGFVFIGFATDAKGKNMLSGEISHLTDKNNGNVTVYAIWEKVTADKPAVKSASLSSSQVSLQFSVPESSADITYEIQCSTSIIFRASATVTTILDRSDISVSDGISSAIASAKSAGTTNYVRIRQIKTDSTGNAVTSGWSKVVKVK